MARRKGEEEIWPFGEEEDKGGPLPKEFGDPERFRSELEAKSGPVPKLGLPPLPVYAVLSAAMAGWIWFGWNYNQEHFPVSLTEIAVFFGVFLVPFLATMVFWDHHRKVRMVPVLARLAASRPGAFLVVENSLPLLFFARKGWIGRVEFQAGSKHERPYTRLEARLKEPFGLLGISLRGTIGRIFGRADEFDVKFPEGEFGGRFAVSSNEPVRAKELLGPSVSEALLRLARIGKVTAGIDGTLARLEIEADLSPPRKEKRFRAFIADAELFLEAVTKGTVAGISPAAETAVRTERSRRWIGVVVALLLAAAGGLSYAEWSFHRQFVRKAEALRAQAGPAVEAPIAEGDLVVVPPVVANYLRFAGVVGKKRIRFVRSRGEGEALSTKKRNWKPFRGEYFFATGRPSVCTYVRNRTSTFFHVASYACYAEGKGTAVVRPMSIYPLRERSGEEIALGYFLRFLTEMPVYPTVFLDTNLLEYGTSDATSAEVTFRDGGLEGTATFFFEADGSVGRISMMRRRSSDRNAPLEKWTGTYGAYKEFGGFRLPTRFEATWNLPAGDVTFAKFTVESVELE